MQKHYDMINKDKEIRQKIREKDKKADKMDDDKHYEFILKRSTRFSDDGRQIDPLPIDEVDLNDFTEEEQKIINVEKEAIELGKEAKEMKKQMSDFRDDVKKQIKGSMNEIKKKKFKKNKKEYLQQIHEIVTEFIGSKKIRLLNSKVSTTGIKNLLPKINELIKKQN